MELQLAGSVPLCLNDLEQVALDCATVLLPLRPAVGDACSPAAASLFSRLYPADKLCIGCTCFHALVELQPNVIVSQTQS